MPLGGSSGGSGNGNGNGSGNGSGSGSGSVLVAHLPPRSASPAVSRPPPQAPSSSNTINNNNTASGMAYTSGGNSGSSSTAGLTPLDEDDIFDIDDSDEEIDVDEAVVPMSAPAPAAPTPTPTSTPAPTPTPGGVQGPKGSMIFDTPAIGAVCGCSLLAVCSEINSNPTCSRCRCSDRPWRKQESRQACAIVRSIQEGIDRQTD
jgi:hypothetical protein